MSDDRIRTLRIGELARLAGVGVETIRYYEREGVLPEPPRRGAVHHRGYRIYGDKALRRLKFILRAKQLGFTLAEIRSLLELRTSEEAGCREVREQADRHLKDVEERLGDLEGMRRALRLLIERCDATSDDGTCPFLDYLNEEEET